MRISRRHLLLGLLAGAAVAALRVGVGSDVVNTRGWSAFARFWTAAAHPATSVDFVRLTLDATLTTLAYAVLGTALSAAIGTVAGPALSEVVWEGGRGRWLVRWAFVVPRAVHEVLWALLLVQVLGFDPLVAVLAIGIPFGAVTAKVVAETIDEADRRPYELLRTTGATRVSALVYGVLPEVRADLVSYLFYRLECAIRSAAVLGVIGAGGLGYQLDLSFQSLRYDEIWTLILALMALSGLADAWSARVRRSRPGGRWGRWSLVTVVAAIPAAWLVVDVRLSTLWSARTRSLAVELVGDLVPPRVGPDGWDGLVDASIDTLAMSILAIALAAGAGLALGALAARPVGTLSSPTRSWSTSAVTATATATAAAAGGRTVVRAALLLARAVPAPMWAFVLVLVVFPGPWAGALALGVYNLGVVGRLFAETFEDADPAPSDLLAATGAGSLQRFAYARLPAGGPRLAALAVYRWEVILRETVVVGVVGAGGLGRLAQEHLAARDFPALLGVVGALVVLSAVVDGIGSTLRRGLRLGSGSWTSPTPSGLWSRS